jgi:PAS domain S-box-containing protein
MKADVRKTAINIVGNVPWGTHFCQFYQTKDDLLDILVPYFKAGLENNEFCMWVTCKPLEVEQAKKALEEKVKDLGAYIDRGQMEILDCGQWYTKSGRFDAKEILQGWVEKEQEALDNGFEGLRLTGNTLWLEKKDWRDFTDYEAAVNSVIGKHRMLAICTYSLESCTPSEIIDVVSNHEFALIRRANKWQVIESAKHKETAEALRESREQYRTLVETMGDGLSVLDKDGVISYVNDRYCKMLGYSRDEVIGRPASDFVDAKNRRILKEQLSKRRRGKTTPYEINMTCKSGEEVTTIVSPRPLLDAGGRYSGSFAVITDITDRKQVEERLRESEEQFRNLAEQSPNMIFIHNRGKVAYANEKCEEIMGYNRAEFYAPGFDFLTLVAPESKDLIRTNFAKHMKGAEVAPVEYGLVTKEGERIDAILATRLIEYGGEKAILGTVTDVTERRQAQEALRKSEKQYRDLVDNALVGVYRTNLNGEFLYANKALADMLGFDGPEQIMAENALARYKRPQDRPPFLEAIRKSGVVVNYELELATRTGESRSTLLSAALDGQELSGTVMDISERKQAEEALRNSQRELSIRNRIAEIFLTTADDQMYGEVLQVLLEAMESEYGIFGYIDEHETLVIPSLTRDIWEKCQVPGKTIVFPRKKWSGIWGRALKEKRSLYANEALRVPEGHVHVEKVLVVPIMYGGQPAGLLEVANKPTDYGEKDLRFLKDIAGYIAPILKARLQRDRQQSERKQAEEALRQSEERYRNVYDTAPLAFVVWDQNCSITGWNKRAEDVFGWSQEEVKGRNFFDFLIPESERPSLDTIVEALFKGDLPSHSVNKNLTKSSKIIVCEWNNATLRNADGEIVGAMSMGLDITEQKQAQEALKRSEERYALAQQAANIGSWDWNIVTGDLVWSEQIEPMFGFGAGEFGATYEAFLECVHPEDRRHVIDSVDACVEEGKDYAIEHRIVWPDGTVRWVLEKGNVVRHEEGRAIRMLGIVQDITSRKQAQEALRESEAKHRRLVETMNEGLSVTDQNYIFTYVNDRFCEMLGYSRPEMLNHHMQEFVDADYRDVMNNQIASRKKGQAKSYDLGWRAKDGRVVYTLISPAGLFDAEGNFTGSFGVLTDISELKEAEARQELAARVLRILNQKKQTREVISEILSLIKEATGLAAVGVRLREGEDFPYFEVNGFSDDFVERENYLCARDESGETVYDSHSRPVLECMCGNVILGRTDPAAPFFTEGGSFWTNSTTVLLRSTSDEERLTHTRNHCNRAGYESVALIPLRSGEQIVGLLQLNDRWPGRFTPEIIRFFEGIGTSMGIALARIKAEKEIESLARFPSENPCSILRIASNGTILYANRPGHELLEEWGCSVGEQVPKHWCQYIGRTLKSGSSHEVETPFGDRIFSLIVAPIVDAGYVNVYGIDITERKQAEEDLRSYREHLEELVQDRTAELGAANEQLRQEIEQRKRLEKQILNVSEREQRRIGQELHDSIGQQLTGIAFMTKVVEQRLVRKSLDEAADIAEIAKLVNRATDQTRGLAKGLHPVDLNADSLMSALGELAANTEKLFGIRCIFHCKRAVLLNDAEAATSLYRIAQEAVTNAVKHGKAKNIRLELEPGRDKCCLRVKNDGLDFPDDADAKKTGMGLQIMNHRAEMIGGSLEVQKGAKGGAIVTCVFPNKILNQASEESYGPKNATKRKRRKQDQDTHS